MAHNRSPSKIRADVLGSPLSIYSGWFLEVDCGGSCPRGRLYRVQALARAHGDRRRRGMAGAGPGRNPGAVAAAPGGDGASWVESDAGHARRNRLTVGFRNGLSRHALCPLDESRNALPRRLYAGRGLAAGGG